MHVVEAGRVLQGMRQGDRGLLRPIVVQRQLWQRFAQGLVQVEGPLLVQAHRAESHDALGDRCDTKHGVLIDRPTRGKVRNPDAPGVGDPVRVDDRQPNTRHAFTPQDPSDLGLEPLDRVGGVQRRRGRNNQCRRPALGQHRRGIHARSEGRRQPREHAGEKKHHEEKRPSRPGHHIVSFACGHASRVVEPAIDSPRPLDPAWSLFPHESATGRLPQDQPGRTGPPSRTHPRGMGSGEVTLLLRPTSMPGRR